MPLPDDMPIRDPKRAEAEPQHSRTYTASTGGWTKPVAVPKAKSRR